MDLNITFKGVDLRLHLVVLVEQLFGLLALVFQFSGQLMVLQYGKPGCGIQLFVI